MVQRAISEEKGFKYLKKSIYDDELISSLEIEELKNELNHYKNSENTLNSLIVAATEANKELKISPWVNRFEAGQMMRFNIIYTETLNDTLYKFVSQNANRNLIRVEGIINVAIIGNQIMIPPIYGDCDLAEINRYKDTIRFINQIILNIKSDIQNVTVLNDVIFTFYAELTSFFNSCF